MSNIAFIKTHIVDDLAAELCRETFRSGKERFVVYFTEDNFEYTEGVFKSEQDALVCYDKLVADIEAGWRP
jgi:hypothetical protein